jgi:hypothetical protein
MLVEQPAKGASEADKLKAGIGMAKVILTRCTGQIRFKDGSRKRIVDKHFDDSDDLTEITIEELDQDDANKIIMEVQVLSQRKEDVGPKPNSFPEAANGECSPARQDIPQAAD